MKLVTVSDFAEMIKKHTMEQFLLDLIEYLKVDFGNWENFDKSSRYAAHVVGGMQELMPTLDDKYFTFKFVNCHPENPKIGKQTVVATGQLSEIKYGYPLMFSEMTVLTALRTAAVSALANEYLARKDSSVLTLIGTGAQSEFQAIATRLVLPIKTIRYFDTDPLAMDKFERNMDGKGFKLIRCKSHKEACEGADIITVCTACKQHVVVIKDEWVKPGMHINGLGGDCVGKTELERDILFRGKVIVEYTEQSMMEGDIQQLTQEEVNQVLHAEMWEIILGNKSGRETAEEVTIFDSVGFAIEDFAGLRLTYDLVNKYGLGEDIEMTPSITDPKDLISIL